MLSNLKLVKLNEDTIINTDYIRWIKKQEQCFRICNKLEGCREAGDHLFCKTDNPEFYKEIKDLFNQQS